LAGFMKSNATPASLQAAHATLGTNPGLPGFAGFLPTVGIGAITSGPRFPRTLTRASTRLRPAIATIARLDGSRFAFPLARAGRPSSPLTIGSASPTSRTAISACLRLSLPW
jgi:hypothetical protein